MVRKYTDAQLLKRVKEIDNFKGIPSGRWILGVRSNEDMPNKFDDKFYEFEHEKFIRVVSGTTHPGKTILQGGFKEYNPKGAAVVRADRWYYNVWRYGLHRSKMPALLQIGAQIEVYRDGDMDGKSEELGKPVPGWYGINYHTNTYNWSAANLKIKTEDINAWSAGCQVVNDRDAYALQMAWYKEAKEKNLQESVTYCLLNEFKP